MMRVLRWDLKFSCQHRVVKALWLGVVGIAIAGAVQAQNVVLVGASQFKEDHPVTRTLREFERSVTECYSGDIEFQLYPNSVLGLEKDYFEEMSQGIGVDYAVVSPVYMSTISRQAAFLSTPFLFGSEAHLEAVLEEGVLDSLADEILHEADVRIIGYAGGSTRNVFSNRPVRSMEDFADLSIRLPLAPLWVEVFDALGTSPTVIAYGELYNALQTGVIDAAENEAAGIVQMRFYETAPEATLTEHAIAIRPLTFANATYQHLGEDLQNCIDEAGRVAGRYGREIESAQDVEDLAKLASQDLINIHEFEDRSTLFDIAEPILLAYAEELGVSELYRQIAATCPRWCNTSCDDHDCHACRDCPD